MVVQASPAVRRRLVAIQRRLLAERLAAELDQQVVAELLGVSSRSVQSWECCYDHPSTPHLIGWAYGVGFRLVLIELEVGTVLAPVSLGPGESLAEHEVRRLTAPLKPRRQERDISQTDLGRIVGVGRSSLQRWEDGFQVPVALFLIAWADRLGYTVGLMPVAARG
ncbi:helix-turn-helix domain-containing protein [Catenulispora rubra]|uniref:helix-turn-helix domain-containing protein n=1 Tax=Catenulispora rubra TaxID=280293 RepID=UPI001E4E694E|nr:helix-turn-helix transcriptional regulator [Catenulispora rubra]